MLNWTGNIHTVVNATTETPQTNLRAKGNIRGSEHFCNVRKIKITLKLKGRKFEGQNWNILKSKIGTF